MDGSTDVRRFLAQQDDAFGRKQSATGGGVPAPRGTEPSRFSEEELRRARLAVARGAHDAEDCKLLLDMLGLTPGSDETDTE